MLSNWQERITKWCCLQVHLGNYYFWGHLLLRRVTQIIYYNSYIQVRNGHAQSYVKNKVDSKQWFALTKDCERAVYQEEWFCKYLCVGLFEQGKVTHQCLSVRFCVNNQDKCEPSKAKSWDVNEWKRNGGRFWEAKGREEGISRAVNRDLGWCQQAADTHHRSR